MSIASRILIFAALVAGAAAADAQPVLVGRVTNPVNDAQANGVVRDPALSGDARYLFFVSSASSLGASSNGAQNFADQGGYADEARRRAFAFVGEDRPAVPALPFGIVREVLLRPLESAGLKRRGRPDRFMRYRYGVEEGRAARRLQRRQVTIKRQERDPLRSEYQQDPLPSLASERRRTHTRAREKLAFGNFHRAMLLGPRALGPALAGTCASEDARSKSSGALAKFLRPAFV